MDFGLPHGSGERASKGAWQQASSRKHGPGLALMISSQKVDSLADPCFQNIMHAVRHLAENINTWQKGH